MVLPGTSYFTDDDPSSEDEHENARVNRIPDEAIGSALDQFMSFFQRDYALQFAPKVRRAHRANTNPAAQTSIPIMPVMKLCGSKARPNQPIETRCHNINPAPIRNATEIKVRVKSGWR